MFYTGTAIEYRTGTAAAIAPVAAVDRFAEEANERRSRLAAERALDEVLADSFPASDPPSWNSGIARPTPAVGLEPRAPRSKAVADADARTGAHDVIDVSRPSGAGRTFLQRFVSLGGATGVALLVPFAILLVGLPVALSVRGVLELFGWLFGVNIR